VDSNLNEADTYTDEELDVNDNKDVVDDIVDANPDVDTDDLHNRVANVHNIALFGVDQAKGSVGRSDAMIILSMDKESKKIKMTSLARDSLVPIDGHGEEKLTLYMSHGHKYSPDNLPPISGRAVFLYGHTHILGKTEKNGIPCVNPGSVSLPKGGNEKTYAIYEGGKITVKTLDGTPLESYSF
jgi:anionic cell wall polymer biosynthesis LytR-Cps2A-Psr (LCP) family protein